MRVSGEPDRARVQSLFDFLFATDNNCNAFANARRLGIMYIIWNRQMFRMYNTDRGWAPYSGSSPHTDHVHFSLTRAGGAGRVSYWNPTFRAPDNWTPEQRRIRDVTLGREWSGIRPLASDFDGDQRDDLLWYDPETGDGFVRRPADFHDLASRRLAAFQADCRLRQPERLGDEPEQRLVGLAIDGRGGGADFQRVAMQYRTVQRGFIAGWANWHP